MLIYLRKTIQQAHHYTMLCCYCIHEHLQSSHNGVITGGYSVRQCHVEDRVQKYDYCFTNDDFDVNVRDSVT